jgi:hypothetical protein
VGWGIGCGFCRGYGRTSWRFICCDVAAMEHLVSVSGTVAVASEIGGAAFASASAFDSSAVA